jgi:hypothetical protein
VGEGDRRVREEVVDRLITAGGPLALGPSEQLLEIEAGAAVAVVQAEMIEEGDVGISVRESESRWSEGTW